MAYLAQLQMWKIRTQKKVIEIDFTISHNENMW